MGRNPGGWLFRRGATSPADPAGSVARAPDRRFRAPDTDRSESLYRGGSHADDTTSRGLQPVHQYVTHDRTPTGEDLDRRSALDTLRPEFETGCEDGGREPARVAEKRQTATTVVP